MVPQRSGSGLERTRLVVTLGDVRGIGPEVAATAARRLREEADRPWLVFVGASGTSAEAGADEFISVGDWQPGDRNAATAGRLAGRSIEAAVEYILAGHADALVTAPIDKSAFNAGGYRFAGHTEFLGSLYQVPDPCMMLVAEPTNLGGALRVVLATTHIALRDVVVALEQDILVSRAMTAAQGLRRGWGIRRPRLALCAVNPHASDSGLFGDEEARIIEPAVTALRRNGEDAHGPISADTVFLRAIAGEFDAVVAPYHDVGMAAFKTVAFGRGVNVTLGLPFPRTSPDHGSAIELAGQDRADAGSMLEAIRLADRLVRRTAGGDRK